METTTPIRPTRQQQHLRRIALDAGPVAAAEARTEVRAAILAWDLPVDESVAEAVKEIGLLDILFALEHWHGRLLSSWADGRSSAGGGEWTPRLP